MSVHVTSKPRSRLLKRNSKHKKSTLFLVLTGCPRAMACGRIHPSATGKRNSAKPLLLLESCVSIHHFRSVLNCCLEWFIFHQKGTWTPGPSILRISTREGPPVFRGGPCRDVTPPPACAFQLINTIFHAIIASERRWFGVRDQCDR